MENEDIEDNLGVFDKTVFAVLLACSSLIGIYFACHDRKNATTSNYFYGSKKMNPVAVGLSIAVTFKSSVTVMATPAETYISGTLTMWEQVTEILAIPWAMFYFMPAFHRLQLHTIFEFLELRFCEALRKVTAGANVIGSIFYVGTIIYLPAIALNAVTPAPMALSIVLTGLISIFYTTLGGIKAVVWNDVLQSGIMILGILAIFIRGLMEIGGFHELFAAAERGQRFTALRFDYSLVSRLSPTAMILGHFFMSMDTVCFSQSIVQKYQSCETIGEARCALLFYAFPTLIIGLTTVGNGLLMYAFYEGCDPVLSGKIKNIDQGVPYMALQLFQHIPGMTGLFLSAVFSACLSTVSSTLNSLAVVVLEDFCVPRWPRLSERTKLIISKSLVIVLGAIITSMSLLIMAARSNVVALLYGFLGLIYGPIAGIYFLGFIFPWATALGSLVGMFSSYALLVFIFIGKNFFLVNPYTENIPPVNINSCVENITLVQNYAMTATKDMTGLDNENGRTFLQDVFNLNFNFMFFMGFMSAVVIGLLISFAAGHTPASEADPTLFIPLVDNKHFPKSVRKFFRFGVPEIINNSNVKLISTRNETDKDKPLQDVKLMKKTRYLRKSRVLLHYAFSRMKALIGFFKKLFSLRSSSYRKFGYGDKRYI